MDVLCANHLFYVFFAQKGSLCWQTTLVHLNAPIVIILTAALIYAKDVLMIVIVAIKQDNAAHAV